MNDTASVNANSGPPLMAKNRFPSTTNVPEMTSFGPPPARWVMLSIAESGKTDV